MVEITSDSAPIRDGDMVGHTGIFAAAIKAVEAIDLCLGEVVSAMEEIGGNLLITDDHGNAEAMGNKIAHQPQTAHTTNRVP